MTMKQVENRVKKLKALEIQQKELEHQMEELKADIKADMDRKGLEEQRAGEYIIRFTTVMSNRFDTKEFREEHSRLYERYTKAMTSRRFSIV